MLHTVRGGFIPNVQKRMSVEMRIERLRFALMGKITRMVPEAQHSAACAVLPLVPYRQTIGVRSGAERQRGANENDR